MDRAAAIDLAEEAMYLLSELEWCVEEQEEYEQPHYFCPSCQAYRGNGHNKDCQLDYLIKRMKKELPS